MSRIGIHWFRKDLRLQDNESLQRLASSVDQVICVYLHSSIVVHSTHSLSKYEVQGLHRQHFIRQSLDDLNESLAVYCQTLVELNITTTAVDTIVDLVQKYDISAISCEWHCGLNERSQWDNLKKALPHLDFIQSNSSNLYYLNSLPFSLSQMPDTFTPFRKKTEMAATPRPICTRLDSMPPPCPVTSTSNMLQQKDSRHSPYYSQLVGGEVAAKEQLNYYLWGTNLLASYKETRNGLDGWDFSSKLSAWLAHGCISPRTVLDAISKYEKERTKNDSTYWLFFELLWREFFHWQHLKNGNLSFAKTGPKHVTIVSTFDPVKFDNWCEGKTGYEIVDACMNQLNKTGFMSNRGRQLVASCFVHELNLDWRFGAAYFEYQLIDFDVASNYGNWQYLAGVGADPRGHRQFNLEKQTDIYDPTREFIQRWIAL